MNPANWIAERLAEIEVSRDAGSLMNVVGTILDGIPKEVPMRIGIDLVAKKVNRELKEIDGLSDRKKAELIQRLKGELRAILTLSNDKLGNQAGGRRASQGKRFDRCVKAVRKTVKARKGSSPESAAIAICTTSILHPRGRTIKRYRKGRLLTQKRR